jgi:hypothetical protein
VAGVAPDGAETMSAAGAYQCLAGLLAGRSEVPRPLDEVGWSPLVALARAEGVGPLLDYQLRRHTGLRAPPRVREELGALYESSACVQLVLQAVRSRLCRRLAERSIPVLLLKGAALTLTCYPDPATRPMEDLDLLIPPARVEDAARCLEEMGFRLHRLPRSLLPAMNRPHVHLVYVQPATQAVVELHWELPALRNLPPTALAEVWSHAVPAPTADEIPAARVMPAGQLLPLLCAHMTLQHKHASLLWLHDLHRVLLSIDDDEAALVQRWASHWGLAPCTAHGLLRVRELFGTPLPAGLAEWAERSASGVGAGSRDRLQACVAAMALRPEKVEMPHGGLINLVMNGDWRFLRSLIPAPEVLRERDGLKPGDSVLPAYLDLLSRRIATSPRRLRGLWRMMGPGSRFSHGVRRAGSHADAKRQGRGV